VRKAYPAISQVAAIELNGRVRACPRNNTGGQAAPLLVHLRRFFRFCENFGNFVPRFPEKCVLRGGYYDFMPKIKKRGRPRIRTAEYWREYYTRKQREWRAAHPRVRKLRKQRRHGAVTFP
jgi:hypothetical protein